MAEALVNSLSKGFSIIRAMGDERRPMTNTEVATAVGLPRPTARRLLLTLVDLGYVAQRNGAFELRPKCLELGYSYLASWDINEIVSSILNDLSRSLGESCAASVLDGPDVRYIALVNIRRSVMFTMSVGDKRPTLFTAAGRVLSAFLPKTELDELLSNTPFKPPTERALRSKAALRKALQTVREQGYALVDQEHDMLERTLAVPVCDPNGVPQLALVTPTLVMQYADADELAERCLPTLRAAAAELERCIEARS